ncbi:MAG: hypothetical protein NC180_12130 [Muribaculaceae bacterium]|nr:hypothetical protein [Roseburia sp.]MCM1432183.1 hypothetical protein [Muribaculaceae bacterium]MCM1493950.1 hypothetical protein [Muribaculaceae bacterium]
MIDYKTVAENSNMIINGYAFTREDNNIRVLNLNNPEMAIVLDRNFEVLETSMSDIEIRIVKDYLSSNFEFMEA